jgi:GT2 family glycosyltransferase
MTGRTATYRSLGTQPVTARGDEPSSWPVEFGIGACQVFHRFRWEAVGGIDETFFYGPEDVDFCLRLIDAGGEVRQVAGAPVVHPPRRRHRKPINAAGLRHASAIARYLVRHRKRLYRAL